MKWPWVSRSEYDAALRIRNGELATKDEIIRSGKAANEELARRLRSDRAELDASWQKPYDAIRGQLAASQQDVLIAFNQRDEARRRADALQQTINNQAGLLSELRATVERQAHEKLVYSGRLEKAQADADAATEELMRTAEKLAAEEAAANSWRERAEYAQTLYAHKVDGDREERLTIVQHLVDLKRDGYAAPGPATGPVSADPELPEAIERACEMRNFDMLSNRANRAYALQQLRLRPKDAEKIASEILRGSVAEDAGWEKAADTGTDAPQPVKV